MKKFLLLSLSLIISVNADNWITDEDAVVLSDKNTFKITGSNSGIFSNHISVRINNEKGKEFCEFVLKEDDFTKVYNIKGVIKDTSGNEIKELESDQIKESSLHLGSTLHSDNVFKYFTLDHFEFPFIVEVSYEKKLKTLFIWPGWYPQKKHPVLSSEYKLILQKPVAFNTHSKGINIKPIKSKVKTDSIYFWKIDSIPAYPDEPLMAPEDEIQYQLLFAPKHFATAGVTGSLESWDTFAQWYRKLCRNKYDLEHAVAYEIDKVVKNVKSDSEKIQLIYSYMQEKTRYVAIELGIGGWQPYSANSVYENDLVIVKIYLLLW